MKIRLVLLGLLGLFGVFLGPQRAFGSDLLIATGIQGTIKRFDLSTGAFLGDFVSSNLTYPTGLAWGPDGNLYVSDFSAGSILRFDGFSGEFLGAFATASQPFALTFGTDKNLYVANNSGQVLRFNGQTGAFMDTFIPAPPIGTSTGLAFHDNFLYVAYLTGGPGILKKFDAFTGAFVTNVYSDFSGNGPRSPQFGPDGNLYVPDWQTTHIYKFDGTDHTLLDKLNVAYAPLALAFGPDGKLNVLIDDYGPGRVLRYDPATGTALGTLVAAGAAGASRCSAMIVAPSPNISLTNIVTDAKGRLGFTFSSIPGKTFTVLGATDLAIHRVEWSPLGAAVEVSPGKFQFTDTKSSTYPYLFFQVRSP